MHLIRIPIPLLAAAIVGCSSATPQDPRPNGRPVCPVYTLAEAPKTDGDVRGDPAWRTIPGVTGFCRLGAGYAVAKQSTARIGWTNRALYVAMDCEEPDIGLIDDKRGHDDRLWLDNGVEVFLQSPDGSALFQFIVNTAGSRAMGQGRDKVTIGDWSAAATKGEDFWTMEAEIPFASLGATPVAGAKWSGAFCRNIWQYKSGGDRFTTWPALVSCFREPESFAVLEFSGNSLSPEQADEVARSMNAAYRRELSEQIEELARIGQEYQAPIARAAAEQTFADEASELSRAWQRINALAADPAGARLAEVRSFIAMADDLERRSHGLKYRFLIEQLLAQ